MWKSWLRSWVRLSILRKGLSGQSRFWLMVGAAGTLRNLQKRFGGKVETSVFGEQLKPGDRLTITYTNPEKKRRAARDGAHRAGAAPMSRPMRAGEKIMLVDSKKRRYLLTLTPGKQFHSHSGFFEHDVLVDQEEGVTVLSTGGAKYTALRPTLAELVVKMPRGAQVIYPKDLGAILILADIFPGARVLESGVGSGALSMALLRAGADIVGYELRQEFADGAIANVTGLLGEDVLPRYRVEVRDCYEGIDETGLDRVVLDLPEPWNVIPHAAKALRGGGILVAYLPTITQVVTLRQTLSEHGFAMAETIEVLQRSWHIEGPSVRPDHRMVAHTGFLTHARLLGDDAPRSGRTGLGI